MTHRIQKFLIKDQVNTIIQKNKFFLIVQHNNLSTQEWTDKKFKLTALEAKSTVVKNRVLENALKNTKFNLMSHFISSPTAIIYGNNPYKMNEIISILTEGNNLILLGGAVSGNLYSAAQLKRLGKLQDKNIPAETTSQLYSLPRKVYHSLIKPHILLVNILKSKKE